MLITHKWFIGIEGQNALLAHINFCMHQVRLHDILLTTAFRKAKIKFKDRFH